MGSLSKKIMTFVYNPWKCKSYLRSIYCKLVIRHFAKEWGKRSLLQKPLSCSYRHMRIGNDVTIGHHARIEAVETWLDAHFTPEIVICDNVSIEQRLHLVAASKIVIGAHSTISFDVMITDVDHEYEKIDVDISLQPLRVANTMIGANCFIGAGAKILAGTVLGDQCIIGANSVVRGSFPSYCIIAGAPARIIKKYDKSTNSWIAVNHLNG
ncbi:TPA: DapH/DapD/GlmU-related protein [Citrobacter amalonaticus]|uniref:acyltransferase n=1 Tax=Citrobacter amalonaticus TaxID=35703 RepID=UPI003895D9EC|nr:acyltransferase [Citrobacter amalonaticus]